MPSTAQHLSGAARRLRWRATPVTGLRLRRAPADSRLRQLWGDLMRDGITVAAFSDIFGDNRLLEAMMADARRRRLKLGAVADPGGAKPYKAYLLQEPLGADDPYLRTALHPQLVALATSYLGLVPQLRAADIWLTVPAAGPAIQTQLWHRDEDDLMNLKLFVYLSDVAEEHGPFCFAPKTHPLGARHGDAPHDGKGRSRDDEMARVVAPEEWLVLTGPSGTVAIADTCGYHKQLKPQGGERLLFMAQFTSARPLWPTSLVIEPQAAAELTRSQRRVLP